MTEIQTSRSHDYLGGIDTEYHSTISGTFSSTFLTPVREEKSKER